MKDFVGTRKRRSEQPDEIPAAKKLAFGKKPRKRTR